MLRTLIRLSDGTEISSGSNADMNIRSCTITQCVNSGDDLTIGSVCAACVEMVVQAPANTFKTDDVFTLYKVDDAGNRTQIGIFNVFTSEKKGEHLYKVTAYDNVIKLGTDLTEWLSENVAYIEDPRSFAYEICRQCGVMFSDAGFNYDEDIHYIPYFEPTGPVTGRKLLQWVGEMLGYFCIATHTGELVFRWYVDKTNVVLSETGNRHRFRGSYKMKNRILPIDSVKIIGGSDNYRSSTIDSIGNQYIVKDNPILERHASVKHAKYILDRFLNDDRTFVGGDTDSMVAGEVSIPASLDIRVGDVIVVEEQERMQDEVHVPRLLMRVMTKIQKGQKDTLQCVGPHRRRN